MHSDTTSEIPHPTKPDPSGRPPAVLLHLFGRRNILSAVCRLAAWLLLSLPALALSPAPPASTPEILILYTYRSNVAPYQDIASAFQGEVTRVFGGRVTFHEVSLDSDRFDTPEDQEVLADFLQKRFVDRRLNLILPIGAPAARFVAQCRDRVFPGTPVVFLSADQRFMDPDSFRRNATAVNQRIVLTDYVEQMLRMAPDTTDIFCIFGNSPLERAWAGQAARELPAFRDRVNITLLPVMPLSELEKRVSALPPHSFIFLGLMIEDGAGITYGGSEALQRLHAVASAPIFGVYQSQLGQGIVGGSLYQDRLLALHAARNAVGILRGEAASNIPPQLLPSGTPVFDWRELKRWGISEARLPSGSSIQFREPTFWERYRWRIAGVVSLLVLQALLIAGLISNLVDRRRVEHSLRRSEQKYRTLHESMTDAFVSVDMSGTIREFNSVYQKLLGYSEEELRRLTFMEITPAQWQAAEEEILRTQVMPNGYSDVYEKEYRRKDGTIFPVELRTFLIRDDRGKPSMMWAIVRDITERKQREQALRDSEERWRLAAGAANVGAYSYDPGSDRIFMTPEALAMYGLPPDASLPLDENHVPEAVHPEDKDVFLASVVAASDPNGSGLLETEYRILRPDGEIRWLRVNGRITFSPDGVPLRSNGIVQDVTNRKHAAMALQRSEERFRQVAEIVSDFIWEVDTDGLYTYTSPSVEKILGYSPDEMVGKMHFYDFFVPDLREHLKAAAFQAFQKRERFQNFPNANISKTGEIVLIETSGAPVLDDNGNFLGYRGADTDVSKRRQADMEAQRLREELAHYSRVAILSELTGSLAHELNQPLAAILANAQGALRLLDKGAPDGREIREIFTDIVADDQRAAQVIRSMRAMLKRGTSESKPVLLNDVVTDVLSIVRNEALARNVSLELDLGSPLSPVTGDRVQLQQVVLNLIVNAFDAMGASDGRRTLIIRTCQADHETTLHIEDSGTGIPADQLESIFEPFVSTKSTGLGVGLSLSRSIVYAHNGRIWADNNPHGGATFHIALPVSDPVTAADQAPRPATAAAEPSKGITVLIVDDRESFRKTVASMLTDLPRLHKVAEAADGLEAVEMAADLQPDLILLDVGIPRLNGIEAARRIRTVSPCSQILFLTQHDSPDFVRAALKNAQGYVLKIDAGRELLAAAEAVLSGRQYASSGVQFDDGE